MATSMITSMISSTISPPALDVERIREDFPILGLEVRGKPLVYLDNAATSQKPRVVIDALTEYYMAQNGNIHRGVHYLSEKATELYDLTRERARIDTKPQLEIFADDVKCTHGATVGRLDEMAAFYMKSRGVAADTTRRLLTYAFAADVLETIENVAVREGLEALVLARFAGVGV